MSCEPYPVCDPGACPYHLWYAVPAFVVSWLAALHAYWAREAARAQESGRKIKHYDRVLTMLEEEQGDWYVGLVLERELARVLKHYAHGSYAGGPDDGGAEGDSSEEGGSTWSDSSGEDEPSWGGSTEEGESSWDGSSDERSWSGDSSSSSEERPAPGPRRPVRRRQARQRARPGPGQKGGRGPPAGFFAPPVAWPARPA